MTPSWSRTRVLSYCREEVSSDRGAVNTARAAHTLTPDPIFKLLHHPTTTAKKDKKLVPPTSFLFPDLNAPPFSSFNLTESPLHADNLFFLSFPVLMLPKSCPKSTGREIMPRHYHSLQNKPTKPFDSSQFSPQESREEPTLTSKPNFRHPLPHPYTSWLLTSNIHTGPQEHNTKSQLHPWPSSPHPCPPRQNNWSGPISGSKCRRVPDRISSHQAGGVSDPSLSLPSHTLSYLPSSTLPAPLIPCHQHKHCTHTLKHFINERTKCAGMCA